MSRIEDKTKEVEQYLNDLESVIPNSLEEYMSSIEKRLASERAFEKIIESVNDLAILFIKEKRFELPDEDVKAFDILAEKNIISLELSEKLKQAKGMRNFLAHQYGKVNDEIIFEALNGPILEDVELFLSRLKKFYSPNI
jgi:uncharacterized protein YutE (UPF0331/DUF86 family)